MLTASDCAWTLPLWQRLSCTANEAAIPIQRHMRGLVSQSREAHRSAQALVKSAPFAVSGAVGQILHQPPLSLTPLPICEEDRAFGARALSSTVHKRSLFVHCPHPGLVYDIVRRMHSCVIVDTRKESR